MTTTPTTATTTRTTRTRAQVEQTLTNALAEYAHLLRTVGDYRGAQAEARWTEMGLLGRTVAHCRATLAAMPVA